MMLSISASHHIFKDPDAPAPKAMNNTEANAKTTFIEPGATINHTAAVKTTKDITRGFSNEM